MSNAHYLIFSYFFFGLVSLGLGTAAYLVLRKPFGTIADTLTGRFRSTILKRALAVSMTAAAVLGFLSVSYTQQGCGMTYDQIVKDRSFMHQANQQQMDSVGNWIAIAVFAWGFIIVICLAAARRKEASSRDSDQP